MPIAAAHLLAATLDLMVAAAVRIGEIWWLPPRGTMEVRQGRGRAVEVSWKGRPWWKERRVEGGKQIL